MDISSKLRKIRKEKNYSTTEIARIAGIGQSTLSEIERGIKQPTIITLEKICSALEISLVDLFDDNKKSDAVSPQIRELLKSAKSLPNSKVELLNAVAKAFYDKE